LFSRHSIGFYFHFCYLRKINECSKQKRKQENDFFHVRGLSPNLKLSLQLESFYYFSIVMKSIVCIRPGTFQAEEREHPKVIPGFSIVKIRQIGICGTDLNAFKGVQPYFSYPRVLGHELAAEYVKGDAPGFSKGDLLTIIPYKYCGNCFACRQDKTNCCVSLSVLGVHEDGGMSEYFSVPDHLLIKTAGLTLDQTAMVEPFAIGAHAAQRAGIQAHDHVLVMGAGPIGIGLLHSLSLMHIKTIVAETIPFRADYCRKYIQHVHCIDPANENVEHSLLEHTNGNMPSIIFDATGNLSAIHQSLPYLSHAGKYILVGLQQADILVNHPQFHKREATLMSSRNATKADFEHVIDSFRKQSIDLSHMITHRMNLGNVPEDFPKLFSSKNNLIKAVIYC
jgi:2-desacetyl-2-hydroxyethyl bacteriochlorophyllide A dehydrogenase